MINLSIKRCIKIASLLTILAMVLAGCSGKSGQSARTFDENWQFVPRVHVEENSFGVSSSSEYWGCSYDTYYEGYWCPKK